MVGCDSIQEHNVDKAAPTSDEMLDHSKADASLDEVVLLWLVILLVLLLVVLLVLFLVVLLVLWLVVLLVLWLVVLLVLLAVVVLKEVEDLELVVVFVVARFALAWALIVTVTVEGGYFALQEA